MKGVPPARRPIPFLGGVLSGALQALVVAGHGHRMLSWFALLPLFFSLARHVSRPGLRVAHTLSFGVVACGASLHPLWGVYRHTYGDGLSGGDGVVGFLQAALAWGLTGGSLCAMWALFGLAFGPLVRLRPSALALVAPPLLWTGIEIARAALGAPWISSSLVLGYGLTPSAPEAQGAAVFGIYGLSFALALTATLQARLLCEAKPARQCLWAAASCVAPVLCFGYGFATTAATDEAATPVQVVAVARDDGDIHEALRLSKHVAGALPACVVWPYIAAEAHDGSYDVELPHEVEDFLSGTTTLVVSGLPPARPTMPFVLGASGALKSVASPQTPGSETEGTLFQSAGGLFGLGLGFDFHQPHQARRLAGQGAEFLVACGGSRAGWDDTVLRQEARFLAYRALENNRWLVASTGASAFLFRPDGDQTFGIVGRGDGAAGDKLRALKTPSVYTRWGWWFEPTALGAAVWLLVWSRWRAVAGR